MKPTKKQLEYMRAIKKLSKKQQHKITYQDITNEMGIKSKSTAYDMVEKLKELGLIKKVDGDIIINMEGEKNENLCD